MNPNLDLYSNSNNNLQYNNEYVDPSELRSSKATYRHRKKRVENMLKIELTNINYNHNKEQEVNKEREYYEDYAEQQVNIAMQVNSRQINEGERGD